VQTLTSPKTVPTANILTNTSPVNSGIIVKVNSALKKTSIGGLSPNPGNIFLVLNVTIQNTDKNNSFEYSDSSFMIYDKLNQNRSSAITGILAAKLNSPIPASGSIQPGEIVTGEIVFGVLDSSNSYKFYVVDRKGTVLASVDNINVP